MGEETTLQKLKDIVYKIVLPVYLWSISFKTLEDYISEIEKQYKLEQEFLNKQKRRNK